MFDILMISLSGLSSSGQSALTKFASGKIGDENTMSFNAMKLLSTFLFFFLFSMKSFSFHIPTFNYAILYGISLFLSTLFGYLALKEGSMAITSLITSYSVIIPALYGIAILKEELSLIKLTGFILLFSSMFLLTKKDNGYKVNIKWLIYIFITFICNGLCAVIQKNHQMSFPGKFTNEFTVISMFFCFLIFLISSRKRKESYDFKLFKYAIPTGICLGLKNFITLILSAKVSVSVLFPLATIFTMIFNILFSIILFKDKFSSKQIMGIIVGITSVLFIN